jgi:sodium-dependent dicarboxylate transporter 2/3/5
MTIADHASTGLSVPSSKWQNWITANWGLALGVAVLLTILLPPTPAGLSIAGQRMLAVFGFAVVAGSPTRSTMQ